MGPASASASGRRAEAVTLDEILAALFRDNEDVLVEAVRQCFEDGASPATHCLFFTDDPRIADVMQLPYDGEAAPLAVAPKDVIRTLLAAVHAALPALLDAPTGPDDVRLVTYSDGRFEFETLTATRFPTTGATS